MNVSEQTSTDLRKRPLLVKIYFLEEKSIQFYMDNEGATYWENAEKELHTLNTLPLTLQVPFLVKFIQDHALGESLKSIQDPIVAIDVYIRNKFISNSELVVD